MVEISIPQIRKIKVLQRAVGLDDDAYREMLWGVARVKSCKDLQGPKIDLVIRHLERCAGQGSCQEPGASGSGPRMATIRQMFAIRRLWAVVSVLPPQDQAAALKKFLKNRYGVEVMEWLTFSQAGKVIEGLKAMRRRGSPVENRCHRAGTPAPLEGK